jgi:N-acetylglucosaminyldiphosphoundecaprenol N-acetyl-beta-D-mannosaminyltransferase
MALSSFFVLVLAPVLLVRAIVGWITTGQFFVRQPRVGLERRRFEQLAFAGEAKGAQLAVLFNILIGEMSFVGPLPHAPAQAELISAGHADRYLTRPGIVSLFSLRQRLGIAHSEEVHIDSELIHRGTAFGGLLILARACIASLFKRVQQATVPPLFSIFGVNIKNTTMAQAVDWIVDRATGNHKTLVTFVNPDCLNTAYCDDEYKAILHDADAVLPDGIGIKVACRMRGIELLENVNGTDLFPFLCERAAATDLSMFLLGAQPGVADRVKQEMQDRYPNLRIVGTQHGYFCMGEEPDVIDRINQSGADLLLVAMGAPNQEKWLHRRRRHLNSKVCIGVGGLFDFYSGRVRRAPIWLRELGMEWVWRLLQEPGRLWQRYVIGNPVFLYRNLKEITGVAS